MAVFIDASLLFAYANKEDMNNKKASKVIENIAANNYGEAITSDYIFDEIATVCMKKAGKQKAIYIGELMLNSEILLVKVDGTCFSLAWEIFKQTNGLSFTDCTTIAMMKVFGIGFIATFDKGFKGIKDVKIIDS